VCVWVFRVRYMSVSEVCMCMGCVVCYECVVYCVSGVCVYGVVYE